MSASFDMAPQAAPVIIQLLKGVLYNDQQPVLWQDLLTFQAAVREYLAVIGLEVFVDEAEGYAFLRQRADNNVLESGDATTLPRLIQRRPLSYPVSLLCVLLRKKLAEHDAGGGETRLILTRQQLVDMLRVFLSHGGSEAKTVEQIERHINKVIEYGFLRRLKSDEERYEVRRIVKALVDADWLGDINEKLTQYQQHADSMA